jgi:hypothetical protein
MSESVSGPATDEQTAAVTVTTDTTNGRTRRGTFAPGNAYGHGRPKKGESLPEKLRRRVEKDSDAIVNAVVARLIREDAVGNRAFADVRDTVYGVPKQTLVVSQGESQANELDAELAAYLASKTVDGESRRIT